MTSLLERIAATHAYQEEGADVWHRCDICGCKPYEHDDEALNLLHELKQAIKDGSIVEMPADAGGHSWAIRCAYCLEEPFDISPTERCPERFDEEDPGEEE